LAQIKIYGVDSHLNPIKKELSKVIHNCIIEALLIPKDKRFHRFFPMKKEDMFYPEDRTKSYIIIEINLIKGRSIESKKKLIKLLFKHISSIFKIDTNDIEIVIQENPAHNFGFRGLCGDEIILNYDIGV